MKKVVVLKNRGGFAECRFALALAFVLGLTLGLGERLRLGLGLRRDIKVQKTVFVEKRGFETGRNEGRSGFLVLQIRKVNSMIQGTGKELTFLRATPTTTFSSDDSRE
jgi:hypothetical protein